MRFLMRDILMHFGRGILMRQSIAGLAELIMDIDMITVSCPQICRKVYWIVVMYMKHVIYI